MWNLYSSFGIGIRVRRHVGQLQMYGVFVISELLKFQAFDQNLQLKRAKVA